MTRQVSGLYHGRGWVVEVGDDAQSTEVVVASIHEAMHDRLQMTTVHGCLVDLMADLGERELDEKLRDHANTIQQGSRRVHEQFATWMSAVPAGWDVSDLEDAFPLYARHLARAMLRVARLRGPYLAMHATQGAARACMQPAGLANLLAAFDLRQVTPSMLDRRCRPDWRLSRLDVALDAHGWGPLESWEGEAVALSPERFAAEDDPEWDALNRAAYEWCRHLLEQDGCPTLPYDGHLPTVHGIGEALGLPGRSLESSSSTVGLMSVESETLIIADRLPAVALPLTTEMAELLAGDEERRHLFLALRPRSRVLPQYRLTGLPLADAEHVAILRCQTDDGTVQLLDVTTTDPEEILEAGAVVVNVSMSTLADPEVARRWAPVLGRRRAGVLLDQRPSIHLPAWLSSSARRLRYAFFGVQAHVGWVTFVAFRIEEGADLSRTYMAPVSRLYAAGLRLFLAESPELAGRVHEDLAIADDPLVRFSVAHILLEERTFDFKAGDRHA